jgi:hypothetical protein
MGKKEVIEVEEVKHQHRMEELKFDRNTQLTLLQKNFDLQMQQRFLLQQQTQTYPQQLQQQSQMYPQQMQTQQNQRQDLQESESDENDLTDYEKEQNLKSANKYGKKK